MKLKAFALGLLGLFMASCSEDDTKEVVVDTAELNAKWYYVSYVVDGEIIPYVHEICGRDYVEFIEGEEANLVRSVEQTEDCEEIVTTAAYQLNGNTLSILQGENIIASATIVELTENKMVLDTEYDFDGDGEVEPVRETYAIQP